MFKFDWVAFFEKNYINYRTDGPNCGRNNIVCKCPWCGVADSSEHMGVHLETGMFGCWRNARHRGRNPVRLIAALLGCSWAEAEELWGKRPVVASGSLLATVSNVLADKDTLAPHKKDLSLPEDFRKLTEWGAGKPFITYLVGRGFVAPDEFAAQYDLRYTISGRWKHRVIVPLYGKDGELLTWVGRAINDHPIRYDTLAKDDGAVQTPKQVIYRPPGIEQGGRLLVVTEGPFDALKVDYYARKYGARSTCVFGVATVQTQVYQLASLAESFHRTIVLYDEGERIKALVMARQIGARVAELPRSADDPGNMTKDQIKALVTKH